MSAYKTRTKARYAAFTKRAAEMKRLRAPEVAAMKARYAANLRGPTLVKVYTQPSDPTKLAGPRKRESEPAHSDSTHLHEEKRRKTSPMTYVAMSKDAANLADTETDKIADVFAAMSVKSVTKAPRNTRIISATFEFQTRASSKMANAVANMSPMPNNTAESRVHEFTRWDQPVVRV